MVLKTRRITFFFLMASVLNLLFTSYLLTASYETYLSYKNPYSYAPLHPQITISPGYIKNSFVKYTVIFLIDGLRYDIMNLIEPDTISRLIAEGTEFTEASCFSLLSSSVPGASAVGSGASPWVSEVIDNNFKGTTKTDSMFWVAKRFGNTTAIVGASHVFRLFSDHIDYWKNEPTQKPVEIDFDSLVGDWAADLASTRLPNVMWVHLSDTDHMAHTYGSLSSEYIKAIEVADEQIRKVLEVYEAMGILDSTLVVVTSDHGHVDAGGHGGAEPEVLHIPLILWGPEVINAGLKIDKKVFLDSIAPTVSMLMGWAIPSDVSGSVLFESLTTSDTSLLATYKIHIAEIRLTQANITLHKTGLVGKYLARWKESFRLLETAKNCYENEPTISIDLAEESEMMSQSILSYVPLGSALNDQKMSELSARSFFSQGVFGIVLIIVLAVLTRVRKTVKGWFIQEKSSFILTFFASLLYYAIFFLLLWTTFPSAVFIERNMLNLSPSYLKSYETFYLSNLGVTLGSLVVSGSFLLICKLKKHSLSTSRVLTWTIVFLISIMTANTLILSILYIKGSCGLSWFTIDVSEGLACSYLAVSNIIISLFALLFYTVTASLVKRLSQ